MTVTNSSSDILRCLCSRANLPLSDREDPHGVDTNLSYTMGLRDFVKKHGNPLCMSAVDVEIVPGLVDDRVLPLVRTRFATESGRHSLRSIVDDALRGGVHAPNAPLRALAELTEDAVDDVRFVKKTW